MAVSATDVVAPVLAAAEVVVLFPACVTSQTGLRDLFRRFVFEGDDFLRVAFFAVSLTWTMTRFATSHLVFPTGKRGELGVRSVREGFELIFVAVFASLTADVIFRLIGRGFGLTSLYGVRRTARSQPADSRDDEGANQEHFDGFIQARVLPELPCLSLTPGSIAVQYSRFFVVLSM